MNDLAPATEINRSVRTPTGPPFIAIQNLQKKYPNGNVVLKGIDLESRSGDFVSLIGPSGCGKSTLLRLIAGLDSAFTGHVTVDGMTPVHARQIASFIFQDASLLPWRTVRGNVSLALELDSVAKSKRDALIQNALDLVRLTKEAALYPRQLSGGMKMRVSIARAMVTRPKLMLMDEPFGALDEISRNRLNEELLKLHREQGWTTCFVTHSVSEAVFLSDRVLVMRPNPGEIAYDVSIDLPRVRTDELRVEPTFLHQVAELSKMLRSCYSTK